MSHQKLLRARFEDIYQVYVEPAQSLRSRNQDENPERSSKQGDPRSTSSELINLDETASEVGEFEKTSKQAGKTSVQSEERYEKR